MKYLYYLGYGAKLSLHAIFSLPTSIHLAEIVQNALTYTNEKYGGIVKCSQQSGQNHPFNIKQGQKLSRHATFKIPMSIHLAENTKQARRYMCTEMRNI